MSRLPLVLVLLVIFYGVRAGDGADAPSVIKGATTVSIDADGVQRETVILDSHLYDPNHLIVQSGLPVELTLRSVTYITPHNFILKAPGAGLAVEINVSAGTTKVVRFTPEQPGVYTFYCDKKLLLFKSHRDKGMEGLLEVR